MHIVRCFEISVVRTLPKSSIQSNHYTLGLIDACTPPRLSSSRWLAIIGTFALLEPLLKWL